MGRHTRAGTGPVVLVDRYRLIERVGSGGMAQVWRAEDTVLQRQVAVKLLTTSDPAGRGVTHDVWRKAREAARLVHPNVVAVYDVDADGDRLFIVMEFVAGRNLAAFLREHGPCQPARVADIGAQTARALAAAHAMGIVHCDVKPGNVLLAADGTVKLTDFGIAALARRPGDAVTSTLVGTAAYVAPEQALGRSARPAGDLYALGCVLYELLVGHPPFGSGDPAVLVRQHVEAEPVAPGRLRPDVPAELEQAVLRLLTKNPADRPQDAAQVAEVLQSISGGLTSTQVVAAVAAGPMSSTQVLPTPPPAWPGADQGFAAEGRESASAAPSGPVGPPSWVGRRSLIAAAVGAVVIIAGTLMLPAMTRSPDSAVPAALPATSELAESPSPAQVARTTAITRSPVPRPLRRYSTQELLYALGRRLSQQVASGQLDPKVARDVGQHTKAIADALTEGESDDVEDHVTEIGKKLNEAAQKGHWTQDPVVVRLLGQLAARY